jgi:uncharacterized protein (TIGR02996 family)
VHSFDALAAEHLINQHAESTVPGVIVANHALVQDAQGLGHPPAHPGDPQLQPQANVPKVLIKPTNSNRCGAVLLKTAVIVSGTPSHEALMIPMPVLDLGPLLVPLDRRNRSLTGKELLALDALRTKRGGRSPDWDGIIARATELLCSRSKDPQLAGRLTEALVWKHGWAGLGTGLLLLRRLKELDPGKRYYDPAHPAVRAASWLNQRRKGAHLVRVLRNHVPVARVGKQTFTWSDCVPRHQAFHPEQARLPAKLLESTSHQHWQQLQETASASLNELSRVAAYGGYGPLSGPHSLRWALGQFIELLHHILEVKGDPLDCAEGQAFLSAIVEDRNDPAPCLVLSDWLEEHDDPARAEFIRLQCERARRYPGYGPPPRCSDEREAFLAQAHGRRWCRGKPWHSVQDCWLGFPARIRERMQEAIPQLLETIPTLCWLELYCQGGRASPANQLRPLLELPELTRLRSLTLTGYWGTGPHSEGVADELIALLASCPHLAGLEALCLRNHQIGPAGAAALAFSPHLARLTTLDLGGNRIGREGFQALLESPTLNRLRWLDVSGEVWDDAYNDYAQPLQPVGAPNVGSEGLRLLAICSGADRLRWLNIAGNELSPTSAEALLRSPYLSGLERLHSGEWPYGEDAICGMLKERFGQRLSWGDPLAAFQA